MSFWLLNIQYYRHQFHYNCDYLQINWYLMDRRMKLGTNMPYGTLIVKQVPAQIVKN